MNQLHRQILKKKYPLEYKNMKEQININTFASILKKYINNKKTTIIFREVEKLQRFFHNIKAEDPNSEHIHIKLDEMALAYVCSLSNSEGSCISEDTDFGQNKLTENDKEKLAEALEIDIVEFLTKKEEEKKNTL